MEMLGTLGILARVPGFHGPGFYGPRSAGRGASRAGTAGRWLLALLLASSWLSRAEAAQPAAPPAVPPATTRLPAADPSQRGPGLSQRLPDPSKRPDVAPPGQPVSAQDIAFAADAIDYDTQADIVIATGNVHVSRNGDKLVADEVRWNRTTGKVTAKGNVVISSADGDKAYADEVDVSENLRDGVVENLLLVTQDGSRLAADKGQRQGSIYVLEHAAYTPCRVEDDDGCPKQPTWQIQADRVVYDSKRQWVHYTNARVKLFGLPVIPPARPAAFGGRRRRVRPARARCRL